MHDLANILTELIFIFLHFFVFLANYIISKKRLFYPPVLFSLTWTIILILHLFLGFTILDQLYPLRLTTYLILLTGTICFSVGSFIVMNYIQVNNPSEPLPDFRSQETISLSLRIIFLGIVVVGLPFYIQAAYRVFLASNIDSFFIGLRIELSYGDEDIGITKYLTSLSFIVFAINYYVLLKQKNNLNVFLVIVSFIVAVVYSVFTTGRTYYFIIFSIYLGINYILNKKFLLKKYLLLLLASFLVFMFLGIIYNKGGSKEDTLVENFHSSAKTTSIYLVSSLSAFDIELKNHATAKYPGENTLLFFVKGLQKLNFLPNTKAGTLLSEFVFVPYPTNVYTVYSPYIRDFGKIYAWLMIALFGALHTFLFYRAAKIRNLRYTLYYSFLLYPLLMSFFQDQYLSLLSTWLQLIFYVELFLAINWLIIRNTQEKTQNKILD